MNKNKHISDYLKYFCTTKESLNFSVLIDGEWGSGKTYFINRFKDDNSSFKFISISLFGVKKSSDISKKIILSSIKSKGHENFLKKTMHHAMQGVSKFLEGWSKGATPF